MARKQTKPKHEEVYYCFNCKKYFTEECANPQGFHTCNKCGKMNVISLQYDCDGTICFEEQDELCVNVGDSKQTKKYLRIMNKLIEVSQK